METLGQFWQGCWAELVLADGMPALQNKPLVNFGRHGKFPTNEDAKSPPRAILEVQVSAAGDTRGPAESSPFRGKAGPQIQW
jgi:hypothetical protein